MDRLGAGLLVGVLISVFFWAISPVLVSIHYPHADSHSCARHTREYQVMAVVIGAVVMVMIVAGGSAAT